MLEVWIEDDGQLERLAAGFYAAAEQVTETRPPLRDIAEDVQRSVAFQFETEGALSGGWQELTPDYEKRKPDGLGILVLSHLMESAALGPEAIDEVADDEVHYVIDDRKAPWHQTGVEDRARGGTLPARPLIVITEADEERFGEIVEDFVRDVLERTVEVAGHMRGGRFIGGYTRSRPGFARFRR